MQKELDYFTIEHSYGGNQDWFWDPMMKIGGCAALTACDSCIYLDCYKGMKGLYPFEKTAITKKDYQRFGMKMKPYLRPRRNGVDALDIYIDGFGRYLSDQGCSQVKMEAFPGTEKASRAKEALIAQIDSGLPLPCLALPVYRGRQGASPRERGGPLFCLLRAALAFPLSTSRAQPGQKGVHRNGH